MDHPSNLQHFAEDESTTDANSSGQTEEKKETSITFPNEAVFMARVKREAKKEFEHTLKELGYEKIDDLKTAVNTLKAAEAAEKTELQQAQEQAAKAEAAKTTALAAATQTLKSAAIQVQATALKVKPERIKTLLKLVDLNEITIDKGVIDEQSVKESINAVLKEMPELVEKNTPQAGADFSSGNNDPKLTLEQVAHMSPTEINKHWVRVQAALKRPN